MTIQAIETKYLGPTNTRGGRVKAMGTAGSVTVPWDYSIGVQDNHRAAVKALAVKLGWRDYGDWVTVPVDRRYIHVLVRS